MNTLTVLPFLLAFAVAVAAMPTDVVRVNAWGLGHEHTLPWKSRTLAALRGLSTSLTWFGRLWRSRTAMASAALVLALLSAQLGAVEAQAGVGVAMAGSVVTLDDVHVAIEKGNESFARHIKASEAMNNVLVELQAKMKRLETFGFNPGAAAELATKAVLMSGKFDFLFGKKVRDKAFESKAISSEVDTYGGYLLTSDQNAFYAPLLVAPSVAMESGIRFTPSGAAEIKMPIEQTDPVAYWTGEGDAITESTPTWALGHIIPRKLAALIGVPNEMLQQGETSPEVASVITRRVSRSMSGALDLAVFEGDGIGQPLGLKNTANINTVSMGDNGAVFTNLDPFADAIGAVLEDNADASAIVMHPRDWKNLLKLKEATASNNKPLLQESAGSGSQGVRRSLYGVPVFLTSRLSTTEVQGSSGAVCSSAYVYDASWIAFAQRLPLMLASNSSRLFNQDKTEIRAILRGNLVVMQPTAVCRILGIKAS